MDLTDIASENITLVRVGERLVILFDNQATIAIEPFFDSSGQPLQDISLQLGPDRIVDGAQFATLFPISTDQSILPAAGEGAGASNTGGQFGSFQIDDFGGGNPLDLLGQETLGGPGFGAANLVNGLPTAFDLTLGLDDDEISLAEGNLGGPGDDLFPATVSGTLPVDFGPDGFGDLFFNVAAGPVPGLTSGGDPVSYALSGDGRTITASTVNGVVFTIELVVNGDATVTYTVTLFAPLDHPDQDDPSTLDVERAFEDNILLSFPFTVQDGNGDSVTATLALNIDDDTSEFDDEGVEHGTVDDEGLGGNIDDGYDGDVAGAALVATGALGLSWGADRFNDTPDGGVAGAPVDGDRALVFDEAATTAALTALGLTASGIDLAFVYGANGTELTAYRTDGSLFYDADGNSVGDSPVDAARVFVVTLSDTSDTGSYTFELFGPLDHGAADTEDDIVLPFSFTAYDSDGDAVDGGFTVTVDDDGPIAGEGTLSTVEDEKV
ncbi:MAG: hypothetical protein C3F17_03425, partial [Bradyrhizobiaceae bacterium]